LGIILQPWHDEVYEPSDVIQQITEDKITEENQTLTTTDPIPDPAAANHKSNLPPAEPLAAGTAASIAITQPIENSAGQSRAADGTPERGVGAATLTVFGNEARGKKFVFLFDRSISMEGQPLRAAKSQLIANLATLHDAHQFQIVFFNHEPETWDFPPGKPKLVSATAAHQQFAQEFVRSIASRGGTYRRAALLVAIDMKADVIFFLTDADAPMAGNDLADAAGKARRHRTAIHTIEFGVMAYPARENFLVRLARDTGGHYVYINLDDLDRLRN